VAFKLPMNREYLQNYIKRVEQVPKAAPHAMEVKSNRVRAKLITKLLGGYAEEVVA